ncbi:MAG: hypothetical protein J6E46_03780 [Faecalicoccus sp.]|nr:hypothetical protein [Faecalicoccus sp.]
MRNENKKIELENLFEEWKKKASVNMKDNKDQNVVIDHGNNVFIRDGIVDYEKWENDHKKILFVLKEAYGGDKDWSLTEWLIDNHNKYRIWRHVTQWTYGIQNTNAKKICKYGKMLDFTNPNEAIRQIAVLNLKKSNGKNTSDYDEIGAYAKSDKEMIKKEIELIDPKIIICGNTFWHLYECVLDKTPELAENPDDRFHLLKILGKNRIVIDFYHPANRWPDIVNYYALLGIYQQALKAQPKSGS